MDEQTGLLLKRLDGLERANRRMKLIGIAVFTAVVAIGAGGLGTQPVLRAQHFELTDAHGKVLAELGAFGTTTPQPALLVYDQNRVLRNFVGINAATDESGFFDYDHNGVLRTVSESVGSGPLSGFSGHVVFDRNGFIRTGIQVNYRDNFVGAFVNDPNPPSINRLLFGTSGTPVNASGLPLVLLNDPKGSLRAIMVADLGITDAEGMFLADNTGAFRAGMSVDQDFLGPGSDFLFFNSAANLPTGNFVSLSGGGGVYTTFDANGIPNGSLP